MTNQPGRVQKNHIIFDADLVAGEVLQPGDYQKVYFDNFPSTGAVGFNTVRVAPAGADFTNVKDALDSILTNGPNNRFVVMVEPGVYQEDNPIQGKEYVALVSTGDSNTARLEATNANQNLFDCVDQFYINGITVADVAGTGYAFSMVVSGGLKIINVQFDDCSNCILSNNATSGIFGWHLIVNANTATTLIGVHNLAGNVTIDGLSVIAVSTVTDLIRVDGANAITTISLVTTFSPNVTNAFVADNAARSVVNSSSLVGMDNGFILDGGSNTRAVSISVFNAQTDGVQVDGVDTNFVGQGLTVEDSGQYDLNVLSASAVVSGFGITSIDNMNFVTGAQAYFSFIDTKEGDEGLNIVGELHVGLPEQGTESVFGGGDSYTRGMLVYTYNPTGAVWTDVSTDARTASGSTFTFPAVAANNAIYVASSLQGADYLQHYGIKAIISTAAVLGTGEILTEYWNGAAWIAINQMSSDSNSPYDQYADTIFERVNSEQVRYETDFLAAWTKNDPGMGLANDYFWIRFRIDTAITTAPIFEQYKLHTSRFEINADGVTEYFGNCRYPRGLDVSLAQTYALDGATPTNEDIQFASGLVLNVLRSGFNNSALDGFGAVLTVPSGLDTSIPVTAFVIWYPDTNNAGDVEIGMDVGEDTDTYDGTAAVVNYTDVDTVAINSQYERRVTEISIDISDRLVGDSISFSVYRDATAGNDPPDTLVGNIVISAFRMSAYFWKP